MAHRLDDPEQVAGTTEDATDLVVQLLSVRTRMTEPIDAPPWSARTVTNRTDAPNPAVNTINATVETAAPVDSARHCRETERSQAPS
jgi:hypothetical protein